MNPIKYSVYSDKLECMKAKVLVIVVTYNGMKWIDKCLSSIKGSSVSTDAMVIDNASDDGMPHYISVNYPEIKLVENRRNLGFGQANNMGLQYALNNGYDYVYLLNQDAWLMPDTIEKLIKINLENPDFGILSPLQLEGNMQHLDHSVANKLGSWPVGKELIEDMCFNRLRDVYAVTQIPAAHWLMSRMAIQMVGGFSPTFYHYGEDDNYADRLYYHKMKLGVLFTARGIHDREYRIDSKEKQMLLASVKIMSCLSDINKPVGKRWGKAVKLAGHSFYKFRSWGWVCHCLRILFNYPQIRTNAERSREEGAFLKID